MSRGGGKLTDPLLFEWEYPENYQTKEEYDRLNKKWEGNRQTGEWDEMKQRHEKDRKSEEEGNVFLRPDINNSKLQKDIGTINLLDHKPPWEKRDEEESLVEKMSHEQRQKQRLRLISQYIENLKDPTDIFDELLENDPHLKQQEEAAKQEETAQQFRPEEIVVVEAAGQQL